MSERISDDDEDLMMEQELHDARFGNDCLNDELQQASATIAAQAERIGTLEKWKRTLITWVQGVRTCDDCDLCQHHSKEIHETLLDPSAAALDKQQEA